MNRKSVFVLALFALLITGAIFVAAQESKAASSESASGDVFTVKPMASCNYVCANCLRFGHNGACTASGSCC